MRFSSNEGQNMAPDVILILIKEGRVVVMERGGLESILLNTINPFFRFGGNKGCREEIQLSGVFSVPWLLVLETWRSAAGDQRGSWTWETGPSSSRPPLPTLLSSLISSSHAEVEQGGVWPLSSVTGDDSLPRGKERGGSKPSGSQENWLFFIHILLKSTFLSSVVALMAQDSVKM